MYNRRASEMADPLRDHESSESRIEELLLAGLDHYFNGQHELAISVWTRVLFLDRNHARARAYIERARGAIAERQREGEELLQTGAAAFKRGDADNARRLLKSAIERGAQPDEALSMLDRLERIAPTPDLDVTSGPARLTSTRQAEPLVRRGARPATLLLVLAIGIASGVLVMNARSSGLLPWSPWPVSAPAATRIVEPLPVPSASEVSLARARAWANSGSLRAALVALDAIRPGDPLRAQADELRAKLQQQLLDAAHGSVPPAK